MNKIKGKFGEYYYSWKEYGWTYAQIILKKEVEEKFLFWKFKKKKIVWRTLGKYPTSSDQVRKMHKEVYKDWITSAVKEYEDYMDSWGKA